MGVGGEVGQGCYLGTALFWSRWEGASSSRYMLCSEADGHQPLCSRFHTDQDKELGLGASRRSDHNLVKCTFCGPSQRDCLSVWFFFLVVPTLWPDFFPMLLLLSAFWKELTWISWFLYWLAPKGMYPSSPNPEFCPAQLAFLSSSPWLSPPTCWQVLLRILWLVFSGIFPWSPAFSPPSLLPASKRDLKALVLCCR